MCNLLYLNFYLLRVFWQICPHTKNIKPHATFLSFKHSHPSGLDSKAGARVVSIIQMSTGSTSDMGLIGALLFSKEVKGWWWMSPIPLPQLRKLRCLYSPSATSGYTSLWLTLLALSCDKIPEIINFEGERLTCTHGFSLWLCIVIFLIAVTNYLTKRNSWGESFIWFMG